MSKDAGFPNLPFVSDREFAGWTEKQRWDRHVLEVAEAARIFGARQAAGMDIIEAAKNLPIPRMNRRES
jgi:hypothetical protein